MFITSTAVALSGMLIAALFLTVMRVREQRRRQLADATFEAYGNVYRQTAMLLDIEARIEQEVAFLDSLDQQTPGRLVHDIKRPIETPTHEYMALRKQLDAETLALESYADIATEIARSWK